MHPKSIAQENVAAVNEALSELYIEDEDHEKLRESVDDYDNFDQVKEQRHRARVLCAMFAILLGRVNEIIQLIVHVLF